jgi:hypothetical protein
MKDIIHVNVLPSGLVELTISGVVTAEDIAELKSTLVEISEQISDQYRKTQQKVTILIDITHFTGEYDKEALNLMTQFAKQNRLFVSKTASFGGPDKARLAGEVVAGMAERDNIRLCDTREEAMKWLGY